MNHHKHEKGQALILIVFAIIGLVAMTGLAIDTGLAFADNKDAQNSADAIAFSAALAKVRDDPNNTIEDAVETLAQTTGYDISQITIHNPPEEGCDGETSPYASVADSDQYIQVLLYSTVKTGFSNIVGVQELNNCVEAVARATPPTKITPFDGNAVIGLAPNGLSFETKSNALSVNIEGGGLFANNNASDGHGKVTFAGGYCTTSVGTATGFTCTPSTGNTNLAYTYPEDIVELLPPIPACDGVAYRDGTDGKMHPEAGKEASGSVVNHFEDDFAPGLYCVSGTGGNQHGLTTGSNVTFYIMNKDFSIKLNGGGGMSIQAPTSGTYKGILMFSNIYANPCTQNLDFRGNGGAENVGTIFMPSACISALGNSNATAKEHSQIIGYRVYVNGNGKLNVNFNPDDNYKAPIPPKITLIQ